MSILAIFFPELYEEFSHPCKNFLFFSERPYRMRYPRSVPIENQTQRFTSIQSG